MDILNIPNFKVSSKEHIWNVIYYNNAWYHIDVTWDDDEINKIIDKFQKQTNNINSNDGEAFKTCCD